MADTCTNLPPTFVTPTLVIEDADGVIRVTADRPVQVLLIRYDDLTAAPQPEDIEVDLDPQRVEQLFRTPNDIEE